ncbi:hypothetical protein Nepgr_024772 [Nepenthes gracilis]|uniref:Uncharacterized protein n=1 Tax=Nepenthes gracilis TaxID=150966 RepID=A0AAD3T521_NEPGR|nr:hypothetical protein Nepgr_024772 [Nepenthes gracilis]
MTLLKQALRLEMENATHGMEDSLPVLVLLRRIEMALYATLSGLLIQPESGSIPIVASLPLPSNPFPPLSAGVQLSPSGPDAAFLANARDADPLGIRSRVGTKVSSPSAPSGGRVGSVVRGNSVVDGSERLLNDDDPPENANVVKPSDLSLYWSRVVHGTENSFITCPCFRSHYSNSSNSPNKLSITNQQLQPSPASAEDRSAAPHCSPRLLHQKLLFTATSEIISSRIPIRSIATSRKYQLHQYLQQAPIRHQHQLASNREDFRNGAGGSSSANPTTTIPHKVQQGRQLTPMNQPQRQLIRTVSAQDLQEPSSSIHDHTAGPTPPDDETMLHQQGQHQPRTDSAEFSKKKKKQISKLSNSPGNTHIQHRKPDQQVASWQSDFEPVNQQTPGSITRCSIITPDQKVKSEWYNNTASIPAGPSAGCKWQFHHSLVAHHLVTAGMLMTNAAATQAFFFAAQQPQYSSEGTSSHPSWGSPKADPKQRTDSGLTNHPSAKQQGNPPPSNAEGTSTQIQHNSSRRNNQNQGVIQMGDPAASKNCNTPDPKPSNARIREQHQQHS